MTKFKWGAAALAVAAMVGSAFAAPISFNGRNYDRGPSGWVLQDPTGSFAVDGTTISVRFVDGIAGMDGFRRAWLAAGGDAELAQFEVVRANSLGIHDLALIPGQDPIEVARRFQGTGLVRWADVNTIGRWVALPNDTQFGSQWHLRNTGQTGGTADKDMDVDEAWDVVTGDPAIVVAIVDSGTDIAHQDLTANLWKNTAETPGNGQDDDGNGYVDDYDGWDFEGNDGNPSSTNGHGTNVAGIVSARTNNGTGVAGIAGGYATGGVRLMPVKVGTSGPNGAILDDAILYGANNGAQIITMSLTVGQSQAIDDALAYAWTTKGAFIDCASGNSSSSSVGYPSSSPNVMAIGATDHNDARASWSNYGSDLEVVAPGVNILTTGLNNTYQTNSGTSFSAPCTAGVAALMLSKNPGFTNDQIRQTLKDTADDVGTSGYDLQTGYGRINAKRAVDAVPPANCVDGDNDGYFSTGGCGTTVDCNDSSPRVYPGAPEICRDGIDQDCNGVDKLKGKCAKQ